MALGPCPLFRRSQSGVLSNCVETARSTCGPTYFTDIRYAVPGLAASLLISVWGLQIARLMRHTDIGRLPLQLRPIDE